MFVLIGTLRGDTKAIGPFETADEARETCNLIGIPEPAWQVVPLIPPL